MNKPTFKYVIPFYILWGIGHIVFFFSYITSQIGEEIPDLSLMAPLLISHILLILFGIAFVIYMLIDCALRNFKKDSEKVVWILVLYFFNIIGAIVYYYIHGKSPRK